MEEEWHDISCKQRIPRLRYIFQVLEQETTTLTLLPSAEAFSSTKYSVFLRIPQVRPSGAGRSRTPICVDVQIQDFTPDLPVILRRKTREEMRRSIQTFKRMKYVSSILAIIEIVICYLFENAKYKLKNTSEVSNFLEGGFVDISSIDHDTIP